VTHWSVQPYGTGISRMKYVGRYADYSKVHFMLVTILLEINCDYVCVNCRPNN